MNKLFALLVMSLSVSAMADTIELNNGKVIEGTFMSRDGDAIVFDVDGISMTFQAADVKNISMGGGDAQPKTTANNSAGNEGVLPAGTVLTVRTNDVLDSGKHATGHKFTATLEGNLAINGNVVVPAGTRIYGEISEAVKARKVAGNAKIMVRLTGFNIDGQIKSIRTSKINAYTEATAKKSGSQVARGAAVGALYDGSDGAKKGAKVGAGAAILSGGNQVVIPPGTILDFTLTEQFSN